MSDTTSECGFVPYPGSGAYGDWRCDRLNHHLGRHRFVNYTIGRVPRVWHVRSLWRSLRADRRLRSMAPGKPGYGYRRALYPSKYEPIRCRPEELISSLFCPACGHAASSHPLDGRTGARTCSWSINGPPSCIECRTALDALASRPQFGESEQ